MVDVPADPAAAASWLGVPHARAAAERNIISAEILQSIVVSSSSQYNLCVRPGEMAAPSSTVPCPTNAGVDVLTYVEEVVVGAAMLLQQAPVVGDVCATFLSFQQLVETAKSNTEDLEVLRDLCDVVIKGVLDKRSDRSGLLKGFAALEKHVKKAEEVSKLCNGAGIRDTIRRCLLARKISGDINGVRRNIVDVSTVNNLAVANDLNVSAHIGRVPVIDQIHMNASVTLRVWCVGVLGVCMYAQATNLLLLAG